jgi:hypothetical protein
MDSQSINIKEEIHQLINDIDDIEFLKAIQTIISTKANTALDDTLSDEEINMLNEREEKYLSGKSKTYTWEEVKSNLKTKPNV